MGCVDSSSAADTRLDYYMSYIHCYSAGMDSLHEARSKTRSGALGQEKDEDDDDHHHESESWRESAERSCYWNKVTGAKDMRIVPEMRRRPPPSSPPPRVSPVLLSTSTFPFLARGAEAARCCPVPQPLPPQQPPPAAPSPALGQLLRSISTADFRNANLSCRSGLPGGGGLDGAAGVTLRKPRSLSADYRYSRLSLPSSVLVSSREAILEEHTERRRLLQQQIYYREQARSSLILNKSGGSESCAGEHWRCRVSPASDRDRTVEAMQRSKRLLPATPTGRMPPLAGECPHGDTSPDWDHVRAQRTFLPFRLPALRTPNCAGMPRDQAGPVTGGSNSWSPALGSSTALWAARSSTTAGQAFARPLARRPQSSPSFQLEALRSLAAGGGGRPLSVFQRSPSAGETTPQRNARSRRRDARTPTPGAGVGAAHSSTRDGSVATSVNIRRTVDEMTVEEVSEAMKDLLNGNIRSVAAKIERLQRPPRQDDSGNCNDGVTRPPPARYEEDLSGEMIYVATL